MEDHEAEFRTLMEAELANGRSHEEAVKRLVEDGVPPRAALRALKAVTGEQGTHWYFILQFRASERGDTCDFQVPRRDEHAEQCRKPAVARMSNSAFFPSDKWVPDGVPHPSTLFVGACAAHLEDLVEMAARRHVEVESLPIDE